MLLVREPGPPRWEASVKPLSYGTAIGKVSQAEFMKHTNSFNASTCTCRNIFLFVLEDRNQPLV
jgi:hypothetical protein